MEFSYHPVLLTITELFTTPSHFSILWVHSKENLEIFDWLNNFSLLLQLLLAIVPRLQFVILKVNKEADAEKDGRRNEVTSLQNFDEMKLNS